MAERRRQEIAEKKAKLVELQRARAERQQLLTSSQSDKKLSEPLVTSRKDVNDLVESLLSSTRPASPYQPSSSRHTPLLNTGHPPSSGRAPSRAPGSTPPASVPGTPSQRLSGLNDGEGRRLQSALGMAGMQGDRDGMGSPSQQPIDYIESHTELYELPSKAMKPVTYSKSIQTSTSMATSTSDIESDAASGSEGEGSGSRRKKKSGGIGRETEDEMRKRIIAELDVEREKVDKELKEFIEKGDEVVTAELSNEQKQAIFAAPDFSHFIEQSTRIVQRALSDGYDYIKDYTIGIEGAFDEAEGQKLKLFCAFSDERWTNGRSVTDLDWSPKFPELLAASYNKHPSAPNDPDGIVAIWNLHLLERPEFIFHSPSDVLSVTFSPFHPTLIFGGTYSGQVLLWDTRAKHLPVLKTPLSASGHTYPIYAMQMVGTQNANNLISSSTDGLVCSWLTDMLAQPQEALQLTAPSHNKTDEISITSLSFPSSETSTFWIGTEEGSIYQANRYDRASQKAGLNSEEIYRGHAGPVTGLDFHPGQGGIDFSDLFLSCSVDWTVKLWRSGGLRGGGGGGGKNGIGATPGASAGTAGGAMSGIGALHSFEEADDYVFDVKWHPNHPAMFGTVDGTGKFDLWNINQDIEVPIASTTVSPRALNKLAWDKAPLSKKVGLGSSDGKVYVYDVAEKVASPRDSEWVEMQKNVQSLLGRDTGGGGGGIGVEGIRYR